MCQQVRVGAAFANHAWSCSGCIVGQHQISEQTSKANLFLFSSRDCHMFQYPLLLRVDSVRVRHVTAVVSCPVGSKHWFATKQNVFDRGAMLAFSGAVVLSRATIVFKTMDMATALWLMQILPMELTI